MAIEIVGLPINSMISHSYVAVYQRVITSWEHLDICIQHLSSWVATCPFWNGYNC
jgi:hypothetical protein